MIKLLHLYFFSCIISYYHSIHIMFRVVKYGVESRFQSKEGKGRGVRKRGEEVGEERGWRERCIKDEQTVLIDGCDLKFRHRENNYNNSKYMGCIEFFFNDLFLITESIQFSCLNRLKVEVSIKHLEISIYFLIDISVRRGYFPIP